MTVKIVRDIERRAILESLFEARNFRALESTLTFGDSATGVIYAGMFCLSRKATSKHAGPQEGHTLIKLLPCKLYSSMIAHHQLIRMV